MNMLFSENLYSWVTLLVVAIVSFILGMVFKSTVVFKQRKQILRLEDEMLANHSRILALEKRITESRNEDLSSNVKKDRDLKAI